ncbi:MAG: hypothetical protein DRP67_02705 [Candidatus Omnitrophota bacterium]|nr:MAG: hypothetical protein DRP67_02705 [Candidatus Omnitrophota bacterium]
MSVIDLFYKMRIAIHQSHYLPWLRYWAKVAKSDVFVILDDVQFTKNDWQNRNKIKGPGGEVILTVPVYQKFGQLINEVKIDNTKKWRHKHLYSILSFYKKAPYFEKYFPVFEKIYGQDWERLIDLNQTIFDYIKNFLGIKTKIIMSSSLNVEGKSSERLVNICKKLGGKVYLTGKYASKVYLDKKLFEENGIEVEEHNWVCPEYPQQFKEIGFIPDLSIIDLLFNCGPESLDILLK